MSKKENAEDGSWYGGRFPLEFGRKKGAVSASYNGWVQ